MEGSWHSTRRDLFSRQATVAAAATGAEPSWPRKEARETAFGMTSPKELYNEIVEVTTTGASGVPGWLHGCFYRNGPGTYENGTPGGMEHLFDGYGMIVKFDIDPTKKPSCVVSMSNSFVKSGAYRKFKETGRMAWREFGTPLRHQSVVESVVDVGSTILGSLGIGQGVTDNASVHIVKFGSSFWAMTETVPGTFEIDGDTLETVQRVRYEDGLEGTLTTAHPLLMDNGKTMVNILSVPGKGFTVYSCDACAEPYRRVKIASIPHRRPLSPAWIHDFPGNDEYIVIPETPLYFNLASLTLGSPPGTHLFLDWIPEDGSRIHIVHRHSGMVHTVETDPFFVFHWANAFVSDDGRYLHIDATVYDDPGIVEHLLLKNVREGTRELPQSALRRMTFEKQNDGSFTLVRHHSSDGTSSSWRHLSEDEGRDFGHFTDFPTVSPKVRGHAHRYVWMSAAVRPTNVTNALVKFDVETSKSIFWHEPGALPGEPCFVPNPHPSCSAEDDGVILSMLTEASGGSALLVLDASSMKELCRIHSPIPIASGFHGSWVFNSSSNGTGTSE